ncbi:MAG: hypothetical protein K2L59_02230 [Muribaculaceae bacterium]|nr:hypothetical protein [Muribaculaceae bacterium]
MSNKNITYRSSSLRRYTLLFLSLPVNSLGIVLVTLASLGTSPISSLPYVISKLTPLSFGALTWILNILFVAVEAILLGRRCLHEDKSYILWQIPILTVFSVFVDIWMALFDDMAGCPYVSRLTVLAVGCLCLVTGISWSVKAGVAMNPGEGIIKVLAGRLHIPFGWTKFIIDLSLVVMSAIVSYIWLGEVVGLREGTVVAAFLVGPLVRLTNPCWNFLDNWLGIEAHVES